MIVSLVFKDMHSVEINEHGNFKLKTVTEDSDGNKTVKYEKQNIKDIPFIRYRFERYGDAEIEYIKKMQNIFKHSAHLAEVTASEVSSDTLDTLKRLEIGVERLCKFLYINMDDKLLSDFTDAGILPGNIEDALYNLNGITIDRVCIKDKTSAAGLSQVDSLRKRIANIVYTDSSRYDRVAVCESPLTFYIDKNGACLTANIARELMAIYCRDDLTQPTPSANHQCMNCCGCIRYIIVDEDLKCEAKKTKAAKSTEAEDSKPKSTKSKNSGGTTSISDIFF